MLFYVTYAIFLAVTVFSLIIIVRQQSSNRTRNSTRLIRQITVLAFADVLILFIPYFYQMNIVRDSAPVPWWFWPPYMIIQLLQTGSLDADYSSVFMLMEERSLGLPPWFINLYTVTLSYLSASIPVMSVLFVSTAFYNKLGYVLLRIFPFRWKKLFVFNEISSPALSLISGMTKDGEDAGGVRFVFCNITEDPSGEAADRLKNLRVYYTSKGPSSVLSEFSSFLKSREIHFMFLAEDEDRNLEDTIEVLHTGGGLGAAKRHSSFHAFRMEWLTNVSILLLTKSDEMGNILDSQDKHGIGVRLLDREKCNAFDLFLRWPLFITCRDENERDGAMQPGGKQTISVLIAGSSETSRTLLSTVLWMGRISRMDLSVIYAGTDADETERKLRAGCPGLFSPEAGGGEQYSIRFLNMDLPELMLSVSDGDTSQTADLLSKVGYIIVSGEDDETNISSAMNLRSWYCRRFSKDVNDPFISVLVRSRNKMRKLSSLRIMDSSSLTYHLHSFGTDELIFSYDSLLENPVYRMMENIQYSYSMPPADLGEETASLSPGSEAYGKLEAARALAREELNSSSYSYLSTQSNAVYALMRLFDSGAAGEYLRARGLPSHGTAQRDLLVSTFLSRLNPGSSYLYTVPDNPENVKEDLLDLYMKKTSDPEILDRMAKAEHSRWNTYMLCSGWITMSAKDMPAYLDAHQGNHKDYLALRHPCITTWEGLEEVSVIKSSWGGGTPDPDRFYRSDRVMVRRLKFILS